MASDKNSDEAIVKHFVDTYSSVSARGGQFGQVLYIPTHNAHAAVTAQRTQTDPYNSTTRKFEATYIKTAVDDDGVGFEVVALPVEISKDVVMTTHSRSGKAKATLALVDKDKGEYRIDVWGYDDLMCTISVDKEVHGPVYTDAMFKGFSFNDAEDKIAYVAERMRPKAQGYWSKSKPKSDGEGENGIGCEYEYQQDFGEQFVERQMTDLFVVDLETRDVSRVNIKENDPDTPVAMATPVWAPNSDTLVCAGFPLAKGQQRLGLIYCFNRPCSLYMVDLADKDQEVQAVCLTPPERFFHSRSPRFSGDGTRIAFLNTPQTQTHNTASCLNIMNWPKHQKIREVVPVIREPAGQGCCPGIYALDLAVRCFSDDMRYIYFTTIWKSFSAVCQVEIENGRIQRVSPKAASFELVDIREDMLLAKVSTPASPPEVATRDMKSTNPIWETVTGTPIKEASSWGVLQVAVPDEPESAPFEVIYVVPKNPPKKAMPLAVFVHGGPHSTYVTDWKANVSFLVRLGYAVCQINYRGSLGFGVDALESLPGNIGTNDVKDCAAGVDKMLAEFPDIDREAIVYCGGSHGGFLGAHLIAKYPDVYKAAVLRNPVTNLVEEVSTADIPDWVYAEAGLPYRSTLRKEDLDKLYALSPISNDLSKIKTPTLLLLGAKDRRVPPSQGLQFYRGLQAAGVKSKVYWFPTQSHPIDDPGCNADCWINSALWYHDALKNTY